MDDRRIPVFSERDPSALPRGDLDVDLVLECTGVFSTEEDLRRHTRAGASHVILSAPTKSENVPTVVHGVNRPTATGGSSPAPTASPRSSRSPTGASASSGP